jgi:hypothetical protein
MQEMLQSVKDKIVLDAELKQLLPLLDLSRDAATADGGARGTPARRSPSSSGWP